MLLKSGVKILATLDEADQEGLTLSYEEKQAVEGKKRKQTVRVTRRYPFVRDQIHEGIPRFQIVEIQK